MAFVLGGPTAEQFFDANGDPLVNGTIEFYVWDTSTPATVYSDSSGTSIGTSVTLNSIGAPQNSGGTSVALFFDTDVVYKIIRKDSAGTAIDPTIGPFYPAPKFNAYSTYSDLKGETAYANGQAFVVLGKSATGDGGDGIFYAVTGAGAGTYTDDAAITLLPTGGDGSAAFLRANVLIVDMGWFGVDYTGATDSKAAIDSMFSYLDGLEQGAFIVSRPGTIRIDSQVVIPGPGQYKLAGYGATIDSRVSEGTAGYGTSTFAYQGSAGTFSLVFEGFYFDGTNVGTNGDALWFNPKGSRFVVQHCNFKGFRHHMVQVDYVGGGGANIQGADIHLLYNDCREATDTSIILSRSDAPTVRGGIVKDNDGAGIEFGQTASDSNRSFLGSTLTGEVASSEISGILIETNNKEGVKIYDARGTKIHCDFESNGSTIATLTGVSGTFTKDEGLTFGTDGDIGATVGAWDSGASELTILRTGDYQTSQTVTGNSSGATGTISTKKIGNFQLDMVASTAGGGDVRCTVEGGKFSGIMPQIRGRQGAIIAADIKETSANGSCPGIVNILADTILDARQASFGDTNDRFGDGTTDNGGLGGVLVSDHTETISFIGFTPSTTSTGDPIGPIFQMDDYVFVAWSAAITDDVTAATSSNVRFYIRNITDAARMADFGQGQDLTVSVSTSLDPLGYDTYFDNGDDGGHNTGDDYRLYVRDPSGTGNSITGHITYSLVPYKS